MEKKEYLVLGATGKTGRRVVNQLRERGEVVRAARSPEVPFDWNDPQTWQPALEGVYGVYMITQDELGPEKAFIAAAEKAGVRRVVLLSARGVGKGYLFEPSMLAAEEALKQSSLSWTILHPTNFSQNFSEDTWLSSVQSGRLAFAIGDVPEAFINAEDIAAVAATVLTEDGHDAQTYEITGPEALTFVEVAAEITKASGRTVVLEDLSPEAYEQDMLDTGYPAEAAPIFGALFEYMRTGANSTVSGAVRQILGRDPISFGEYARKTAESGIWK